MLEIGIDPGLKGAVGFLGGMLGPEHIDVRDTPTAEVERGRDYLVADMVRVIQSHGGHLKGAHATIEGGRIVPNRIKGKPEFRGQSASSTAKQWRGIGLWEGILAGLGIPYTVVAPSAWKHALGVTADKMETMVVAQRLFPAAAHLLYRARDDGRAEALLIAEYGRRLRAGEMVRS